MVVMRNVISDECLIRQNHICRHISNCSWIYLGTIHLHTAYINKVQMHWTYGWHINITYDIKYKLHDYGSVALLSHFQNSHFTLMSSAKFTVAHLNPVANDSLGHQYHAKKLSPEIALHLKWSVKVKQRYLSLTIRPV